MIFCNKKDYGENKKEREEKRRRLARRVVGKREREKKEGAWKGALETPNQLITSYAS